MSNVTTHARFGANVEALKQAGVDVNVHRTEEDLSDVHLDEPRYGEMLLGDLTDDEKIMFVDLFRAKMEQERLAREYMGAAIARVGEMIRRSDANKPLTEAFSEEPQQMDFGSPENQLAFFRLEAKINLLKGTLYWSIGERFGAHDWSIGVRTKYRAYKVKSRV